MKKTPEGWPRMSASLSYDDAAAAIDFLCRAFGFEVRLKVDGGDGTIAHSELICGEALVMLGSPRAERPWRKSPKTLGGVCTQSLMLFVDDADAHAATAKAAGATIASEPATVDYGEDYWVDRGYEAIDLEGHHWYFVQRISDGKSAKKLAVVAMKRCLLILAVSACSRAAVDGPAPAPVPSASAPASSPASRDEVRVPSDGRSLKATLFRPAGRGPFPAIVYNHGSGRDPDGDTFAELGAFFQEHGFVVLFPYRRGSGGSEGPYWRDGVETAPADARGQLTVEALERENDDVVAAVSWLRAQPRVDGARLAVAGCSFGGIHTLLAASRPIGIHAAVDFAGASMSWKGSAPLRARLVAAVREAKAPIFLLQAENDFDTTPSRVLSEEMVAAGKPQKMKIYPPHGTTPQAGHAGFCLHGMEKWGADVLAFLRDPAG